MNDTTLHNARRLVTALAERGQFPHPVNGGGREAEQQAAALGRTSAGGATIEKMETHISWVLLAGDYAYKIKKPVELGFLDYSTLEKRRELCELELQLNRRLAPELYLSVVPISGTMEQPEIDGAGPPREYAVRMRRFDQRQLLSALLERDSVSPSDIDALAREIARFHSAAPVADADSPYGSDDAVIDPAMENFEHLKFVGDPEDQRALRAQLHVWMLSEFDARRGDFYMRRRCGAIRECHGDLHLNNIVKTDAGLRAFDCIEFNPAFRWIDVVSDLAFCVMDLADRGRSDYGNRLLNAYLESTGDYGGLVVLPFYLAYRALVRAKVDCLRSEQGLAAPSREELCEDFHRYLRLAFGYTKPLPRRLIITHGPSGSGKTYGTQALVDRFGAIRVRSDVERKRLKGVDPEDASSLYSAETTERTYARLLELAECILEAGRPVVTDATFFERAHRGRFHDLARKLDVPFVLLSFDVEDGVLRERVRRRQSDRQEASDADEDVLDQQLRRSWQLGEDEREHSLIVTAKQTPEEIALACRTY